MQAQSKRTTVMWSVVVGALALGAMAALAAGLLAGDAKDAPAGAPKSAARAAQAAQPVQVTDVPIPTQSASTDGIQLLVGGMPQPFAQGTVVPVVANLMGKLELKPARARFLRNFDLLLFEETDAAPYDRADVMIQGSMPDMPHGQFKVLAIPTGDGHYSVELPCGMNGQWEFDVNVGAAGKTGSIKILVDIYE